MTNQEYHYFKAGLLVEFLTCLLMRPVTGLGGPGSSKKMTYGKGFDYPTEKAAVAAAEKWVKAEMKRQGITK